MNSEFWRRGILLSNATMHNYLTIVSREDNLDVMFYNYAIDGSIEYCINGSRDWQVIYDDTEIPTLNNEEFISFRGNLTPSDVGVGNFHISGQCDLTGNCNSLIFGDDACHNNDLSDYHYTFQKLFEFCDGIVAVCPHFLPATSLGINCYEYMFQGCTSLVTPPTLPATTLESHCYSNMFQGCTSLTSAPVLPATTLADYCYQNMFGGCTSLTTAPTLPATTLATHCYSNMFNGCTSLTSAPVLPATSLASYCYSYMFNRCTSLTSAPALPVTTLATYCYSNMFNGCTSLTTTPYLPATTMSNYCYYGMFQGCTSLTSCVNLSHVSTLAQGCFYAFHKNCTKLTSVTQLPVQTLYGECYRSMFEGCTSLLSNNSVTLPATTLAKSCYRDMFKGCTSLISAILSRNTAATTLATYCYYGMFEGCTSLRTLSYSSPLNTTTLANYCYQNMFKGCTSLTTAPTLPATTLGTHCYRNMFSGCTSLTTAPTLPATSLKTYCYYGMFQNCTALTTAPTLPATTLATYCYNYMFDGCSSLTTAPALPAKTLTTNCYSYMFRNCKNLNRIEAMFTTTPSTSYTNNWLYGVASSGTFYRNGNSTWNVSGVNGIPSGWGVVYKYPDSSGLRYFTVKVNSNWIKSTSVSHPGISESHPLIDGSETVWESTNKGVSNSGAFMYITIKDYDEFTLYVRSYAEANWDYIMVSQLDKTIDNTTSYTNEDLVIAHTYGKATSINTLENYTEVNFTNIIDNHGSGEHHFMVVFRKDGSGNQNSDCGYVIIPNGNNN